MLKTIVVDDAGKRSDRRRVTKEKKKILTAEEKGLAFFGERERFKGYSTYGLVQNRVPVAKKVTFHSTKEFLLFV